jgi:hypothetical protein
MEINKLHKSVYGLFLIAMFVLLLINHNMNTCTDKAEELSQHQQMGLKRHFLEMKTDTFIAIINRWIPIIPSSNLTSCSSDDDWVIWKYKKGNKSFLKTILKDMMDDSFGHVSTTDGDSLIYGEPHSQEDLIFEINEEFGEVKFRKTQNGVGVYVPARIISRFLQESR